MGEIVVFGDGGHARVVRDLLRCAGGPIVVASLAVGEEARLPELGVRGGIVAVGDNDVRASIVARVEEQVPGFAWHTAIHPSATVASDVVLGHGTVVMAGTIINPGTIVGAHVILNTGSVVDHDGAIDAFAHVAPGTVCAGNVAVGEHALVGIGARVNPGCRIGPHTIVGTGSVVTRDIPGGVIAFGVPCGIVRNR
ncbi:MAG: hypothetical protein CMJ83_08325 [Planctomycetes bacterium]|jgi:sugar O-acyltransferase (sialic acid O-acetyltransferase NeuD family)|nr:hypothetical protein [Planctomycetota bacterium]